MARTKKTPVTTALHAEKGTFDEDQQGKIWTCTDGRMRKPPNGPEKVDMRATTPGKPTGEWGERYVDLFVRKLTKAELAAHAEIERRGAESLKEAQASTTALVDEGPAKSVNKDRSEAAQPKTTSPQKTEGKLSALDAVAKVLANSGKPMTAKAMIEVLAARKYWTSPGGQTPQSMLYTVVTMLPNLAP